MRVVAIIEGLTARTKFVTTILNMITTIQTLKKKSKFWNK